jgi:hypothetical protein
MVATGWEYNVLPSRAQSSLTPALPSPYTCAVMGIHFANAEPIDDGALDPERPELLG